MERHSHIDFLRAVCIIGFIAIHVLSYNLVSPLNNFIWNYLHFVVGGFVFCSGYVLAKYENKLLHFVHLFEWYYKRILRLIIPYYWFVFSYIFLLFLVPHYLSGIGMRLVDGYIVRSLFFLEGGSNFSWLPLLFLQLTILFPFILSFFKKKTKQNAYLFFVFMATLFFSLYKFPYDYYRFVMWIPWSFVLWLGIWFHKKEQKSVSKAEYLKITVISALLFFVFSIIWKSLGVSMNIIDNKYPPNFYDLTFEIFGTGAVLLISQLKIFSKESIKKIYTILSQQSYPVFFIHIIILDFIITANKKYNLNLGAFIEFLVVIAASILINTLLHKVILLANNYKKE